MYNITDYLHIGKGLLALIVIWSLIWKGLALWRAATLHKKGWFVALLILNTVGILDILYLYVFSKRKHSDTTPTLQ